MTHAGQSEMTDREELQHQADRRLIPERAVPRELIPEQAVPRSYRAGALQDLADQGL